jgi:hypothetical protein
MASHWWFPLPPRALTLAADEPQGSHARLAERYRDELGRKGIAVQLTYSPEGTLSPLQRLATTQDPVQAGFAHGLLSDRVA